MCLQIASWTLLVLGRFSNESLSFISLSPIYIMCVLPGTGVAQERGGQEEIVHHWGRVSSHNFALRFSPALFFCP